MHQVLFGSGFRMNHSTETALLKLLNDQVLSGTVGWLTGTLFVSMDTCCSGTHGINCGVLGKCFNAYLLSCFFCSSVVFYSFSPLVLSSSVSSWGLSALGGASGLSMGLSVNWCVICTSIVSLYVFVGVGRYDLWLVVLMMILILASEVLSSFFAWKVPYK